MPLIYLFIYTSKNAIVSEKSPVIWLFELSSPLIVEPPDASETLIQDFSWICSVTFDKNS